MLGPSVFNSIITPAEGINRNEDNTPIPISLLARQYAHALSPLKNFNRLLYFGEPTEAFRIAEKPWTDRVLADARGRHIRKPLDMKMQMIHRIEWRYMESHPRRHSSSNKRGALVKLISLSHRERDVKVTQ